MSQTAPETGVGAVDFLTVAVGGRPFAVEVGKVRQVLDRPPITRIPRTPETVLGITNVAGDLTVVLDGHGLLGVGKPPADGQLIGFEGESGGHPIAVPIDDVGELTQVSTDRVIPATGEAEELFVASLQPPGDASPRGVLDPDRLVAAVHGAR